MTAYLVPCAWSLLVVIGLAIHLSNPFRQKFENGFLWKNIAWVILPPDYSQFNDSQKIEFWRTATYWRRRRTIRSVVYAPLIWIVGFGIIFLASSIHVSPVNAKEPTATVRPTLAVTTTVQPTGTPTRLSTQSAPATGDVTPTRTATGPTQTPRVVYIYQTENNAGVITGPTQTPWVWVVTATFTPVGTRTPTATLDTSITDSPFYISPYTRTPTATLDTSTTDSPFYLSPTP
jgi:hypothetical protein